MCWSPEVSFTTFAFSAASGLVAARAGLGVSSLYWLFISMQLVEGFIWLDQGCSGLNQFASLAGAALVCLQPLAALMASDFSKNTNLRALYAAATAVFFGFVATRSGEQLCTAPPAPPAPPSRHLSWRFLPSAGHPVTLFWFVLFLAPSLCTSRWFESLFLLGIIGSSVWFGASNQTWGTQFCYWANAAGFAQLWRAWRR